MNTTNPSSELLPCPFCGGRPVGTVFFRMTQISCRDCGCGISMANDEDNTPPANWREKWNTRTPASPAVTAGDARDAARYRWVRVQPNTDIGSAWILPATYPVASSAEELDRLIDAAIAARSHSSEGIEGDGNAEGKGANSRPTEGLEP